MTRSFDFNPNKQVLEGLARLDGGAVSSLDSFSRIH